METFASSKGRSFASSKERSFINRQKQIAGILRRKNNRGRKHHIQIPNERAPHLKQFLRSSKAKYRRRRGTKIREKVREQAKKRRIDERPGIIERRVGWRLGGERSWAETSVYASSRSSIAGAGIHCVPLPKMNAQLLSKLAIKQFGRIPKKKRKPFTHPDQRC